MVHSSRPNGLRTLPEAATQTANFEAKRCQAVRLRPTAGAVGTALLPFGRPRALTTASHGGDSGLGGNGYLEIPAFRPVGSLLRPSSRHRARTGWSGRTMKRSPSSTATTAWPVTAQRPAQDELVKPGRYPLIMIDEVGCIPVEAEAATCFFLLISNGSREGQCDRHLEQARRVLGRGLRRRSRRRRGDRQERRNSTVQSGSVTVQPPPT